MATKERNYGFTLLEAMIALVIVSVGMTAVYTQLNRYVISTAYLEEKTLASWIASNQLTLMSTALQWPSIGTTQGEEEFARRLWIWRAEVAATPIENLRRVDISVSLANKPELEIHTMSALLEPPPPPNFPPVDWSSVGNAEGFSFSRDGAGGNTDNETGSGDGDTRGMGDSG